MYCCHVIESLSDRKWSYANVDHNVNIEKYISGWAENLERGNEARDAAWLTQTVLYNTGLTLVSLPDLDKWFFDNVIINTVSDTW